MKLKIKVTKDILKKSSGCTSSGTPKFYVTENCAIALSVRDIFPKARVYVNGKTSFFGEQFRDLGEFNSCQLPYIAVQFIRDFDMCAHSKRQNMPEIEFEIEIPDEVVEKINIDEIRPLLQDHPTLQLV